LEFTNSPPLAPLQSIGRCPALIALLAVRVGSGAQIAKFAVTVAEDVVHPLYGLGELLIWLLGGGAPHGGPQARFIYRRPKSAFS
jgi:hypothetical protein